MKYIVLEKLGINWKLIDSGELPKLYKLWLENPVDRIIVKEVEVEMREKEAH
jgi:hypothetical protein